LEVLIIYPHLRSSRSRQDSKKTLPSVDGIKRTRLFFDGTNLQEIFPEALLSRLKAIHYDANKEIQPKSAGPIAYLQRMLKPQ